MTRTFTKAQAALRSVRDQRDEWAEVAWQRGQKLREVRKQRNEAQARVAELEQAIREHHGSLANQHALDEPRNMRLHSVLDGHDCHDRHDRQESGDEPVTHQDDRRYRLAQDGERSFRAVEDDVRHPRSGRFKRPFDWAARTGGSFKGVRRER